MIIEQDSNQNKSLGHPQVRVGAVMIARPGKIMSAVTELGQLCAANFGHRYSLNRAASSDPPVDVPSEYE